MMVVLTGLTSLHVSFTITMTVDRAFALRVILEFPYHRLILLSVVLSPPSASQRVFPS
jgi:hypothetical protein